MICECEGTQEVFDFFTTMIFDKEEVWLMLRVKYPGRPKRVVAVSEQITSCLGLKRLGKAQWFQSTSLDGGLNSQPRTRRPS